MGSKAGLCKFKTIGTFSIIFTMPKIKCNCGNIIGLGGIPNPYESLLISDIDFGKYWEKYDVEQLYKEMKIVVKCDNCSRLHIFFNGFDKPATIYKKEEFLKVEEIKFNLYLTVLRFLPFKITENLRRIYLNIEIDVNQMELLAFYKNPPTELELELFDDIITDSNAHIPDFFVKGHFKLMEQFNTYEKHDFIIFSVYE